MILWHSFLFWRGLCNSQNRFFFLSRKLTPNTIEIYRVFKWASFHQSITQINGCCFQCKLTPNISFHYRFALVSKNFDFWGKNSMPLKNSNFIFCLYEFCTNSFVRTVDKSDEKLDNAHYHKRIVFTKTKKKKNSFPICNWNISEKIEKKRIIPFVRKRIFSGALITD